MVDLNIWLGNGVYAFVCEEKKRFQVFYSRNVLNSATANVKHIMECPEEYGSMKEDMDKIDLVLLEKDIEESEDKSKKDTHLKVRSFVWTEWYINEGYFPYRDRYLLQYRLRDGIITIGLDTYYGVWLQNKNDSKIMLALFNDAKEGIQWKNITYPNGKIREVVYMDNGNRELLKSLNTRSNTK